MAGKLNEALKEVECPKCGGDQIQTFLHSCSECQGAGYVNQLVSDTQSYYTPDPGVVEGHVYCGVCCTRMKEERNSYGPRSWVMAMSHSKDHYDAFTCPLRNELWHRQVAALRHFAERQISGRWRMALLDEARLVLSHREATVDQLPDGAGL